ncbi:hypothetical protein, partial [Micrococcus luteus]|uniref:hypothetical protein n=1 Tax=Micrococcus luteus TaxID=1270 RepID=UPI001C92ED17
VELRMGVDVGWGEGWGRMDGGEADVVGGGSGELGEVGGKWGEGVEGGVVGGEVEGDGGKERGWWKMGWVVMVGVGEE